MRGAPLAKYPQPHAVRIAARCSNRARRPARPTSRPRCAPVRSRASAPHAAAATRRAPRAAAAARSSHSGRRAHGAGAAGAATAGGRRRGRTHRPAALGPVILEQRQAVDRPLPEPGAQPLDERMCLAAQDPRHAPPAATASARQGSAPAASAARSSSARTGCGSSHAAELDGEERTDMPRIGGRGGQLQPARVSPPPAGAAGGTRAPSPRPGALAETPRARCSSARNAPSSCA